MAHSVHELWEAALVPTLVEQVWDLNPILSEDGTVGILLKALFGYTGHRSLIEGLSYGGMMLLSTSGHSGRTRGPHRRLCPHEASTTRR